LTSCCPKSAHHARFHEFLVEAAHRRQQLLARHLAGLGFLWTQPSFRTVRANPGFRYAVITDSDVDPGAVVVHVGIRGVVTGEIVVASSSYDGIVLLNALEAAT